MDFIKICAQKILCTLEEEVFSVIACHGCLHASCAQTRPFPHKTFDSPLEIPL